MQLYIDNRSGAPIYDQIYSQIKDAIVSGQVAAGEALPSIRALAKDLRIIEGYMQEIRRLAAACGLTEDELAEIWRVQKEETE